MVVAVLAVLGPSEPEFVTVPVRPAGAFADSVGVATHADYLDTPYRDQTRVLRALQDLGIRHIRAGAQSSPNPELREFNARHDAFLRRLAAAGIRTDLVIGLPGDRQGTVEQSLAAVKGRLRGAVESLEGTNEPDLFAGAGWAERTRAHQRELYARAKADPALRRLPVLAPSLGSDRSPGRLGDVMQWADYGNSHPYPGGLAPESLGVGGRLRSSALNARGKPLFVTETGYHNALRDRTDHPPASERAAGAYIPRLLLDQFDNGIVRTFIYELIDEFPDPGRDEREKEFGLLRNDFSLKPAARNLRTLLRLARGGGAPARVTAPPASLRLRLDGDAFKARRVALGLKDGSVLLLLWQDVAVWDRVSRVDVHQPAATGRLSVEGPFAGADVLRLGRGPRPLARVAEVARPFTVRVPADDVLVLRLRPAP